MTNKKVIIRVDGNSKTGLGHIYRGIALAEMLKDDFEVSFLTRSTSITSPISDADFNLKNLPKDIALEDEPNFFSDEYGIETIIVLDGYVFTEDYQQKIKDKRFKLIYIDDLVQGVQKADVVINHNPGVKESDYKSESYTKLALGLDYAVLRPSFINFNRNQKKSFITVENVFVSFGGADPNDLTFKVVEQLVNNDSIKRINIVLGTAYNHTDIYRIVSNKIEIYSSLSEKDVFKVMNRSDLAIVPASTTGLELAFLGIPLFLGYFVENQKGIYKGFTNNNACIPLGDLNIFNFDGLNSKVSEYQTNKFKVSSLNLSNPSENIRELFNLNELKIRQIENEDMEFVFSLSNESLVRKNSYNSEPIKLIDHKKWFKNQLKYNRQFFFILEEQDKPVGQVRFDLQKDHAVIGISISEKFRGKGYAIKGLKLALNEYFKNNSLPVYAYIMKSNSASVKLFEKTGFLFYKELEVKGISSFLYKKEKHEN